MIDYDDAYTTVRTAIQNAETIEELAAAINGAEFDEGFGADLVDGHAVIGYNGESTALYVRFEDGEAKGTDGSSDVQGIYDVARWIVNALAGG